MPILDCLHLSTCVGIPFLQSFHFSLVVWSRTGWFKTMMLKFGLRHCPYCLVFLTAMATSKGFASHSFDLMSVLPDPSAFFFVVGLYLLTLVVNAAGHHIREKHSFVFWGAGKTPRCWNSFLASFHDIAFTQKYVLILLNWLCYKIHVTDLMCTVVCVCVCARLRGWRVYVTLWGRESV